MVRSIWMSRSIGASTSKGQWYAAVYTTPKCAPSFSSSIHVSASGSVTPAA